MNSYQEEFEIQLGAVETLRQFLSLWDRSGFIAAYQPHIIGIIEQLMQTILNSTGRVAQRYEGVQPETATGDDE